MGPIDLRSWLRLWHDMSMIEEYTRHFDDAQTRPKLGPIIKYYYRSGNWASNQAIQAMQGLEQIGSQSDINE